MSLPRLSPPFLEALEPRCLLAAGGWIESSRVLNLGYFYSSASSAALDASGNLWIAGEADTDTHAQTMLTARFGPGLHYERSQVVVEGNFTAGRALAMQPDGKVVVAGDRSYVDGGPRDLVVARFNADGSPDRSFGAGGDGVVVLDLGESESGSGVAIQSDGKIVVAGHDDSGMLVVRYQSSGQLDTTFGTGGVARISFGADTDAAASTVLVAPGGKIVISGYASDPISGDACFAIARLTGGGVLDGSFGKGGKVTDAVAGGAFIYDAVLRSDGTLVVVGESRATPAGDTDLTLAAYGVAGARRWLTITDIGTHSEDVGNSVVAAPDGSLWVAGATERSGTGRDMLLARYRSDGSLHTGFNATGDKPGTLAIDVDGQDDRASKVLRDTDGTLILVGSAMDYLGNDLRLALYRVDPSGDGPGGGNPPHIGASHIGVYRNGQFILDWDGVGGFSAGDLVFSSGHPGDIPVVGDWLGDGRTRAGVFRDGIWILDTNGIPGFQDDDTLFAFGMAGWTPVVGDWNGDGIDDVGVFNGARWGLDSDGVRGWHPGRDEVVIFGEPRHTPVVGDWNGDGKSDIGVFAEGVWGLDSDGVRGWHPGSDASFAFGAAGMTPVVGDWNGDGKSNVGVYHNGTWGLDSDGVRGWNAVSDAVFAFGAAGMVPVVGDWNNDGRTDVGVFSGARWGLDSDGVRGWTAGDKVLELGENGDQPLVGRW